jgi:hypothetical protein
MRKGRRIDDWQLNGIFDFEGFLVLEFEVKLDGNLWAII